MGWVSVTSVDVIHDGSLVPAYACVFAMPPVLR